jgi:hypothetical protein
LVYAILIEVVLFSKQFTTQEDVHKHIYWEVKRFGDSKYTTRTLQLDSTADNVCTAGNRKQFWKRVKRKIKSAT